MARRLSPEQRREQLVRAAMGILAGEGYEALSFEAVARAARVTRNLLYHYFPGGVIELFRACAELAGADLVADWTVDATLPLDERRARNFAAMARHAGTPTDSWLVSRITVGSADPEVRATTARVRGHVVSAMSLNALGTTDPPPLAAAALSAYLAFAESLLDRARDEHLDGADVVRVLEATLESVVASAPR